MSPLTTKEAAPGPSPTYRWANGGWSGQVACPRPPSQRGPERPQSLVSWPPPFSLRSRDEPCRVPTAHQLHWALRGVGAQVGQALCSCPFSPVTTVSCTLWRMKSYLGQTLFMQRDVMNKIETSELTWSAQMTWFLKVMRWMRHRVRADTDE